MIQKKEINKRLLIAFLIVLVVIVIDQIIKYWVKTNFVYGEERPVFGNWFSLLFIENNGMAFGLEFAGNFGKYILTFFRIIAVVFIGYYIVKQTKIGSHKGFIYCLALVLAGALGNIIDSLFYGHIFRDINHYPGSWFQGKVVDMFYFPIITGNYPTWFPVFGGEEFIFFRPVFNFADTAISLGVVFIFIFQNKFFKSKPNEELADETIVVSEDIEIKE